MLYFFRVLIILLKGIIPRFASVVSMLWFVSAVSFRSFRPIRSFRCGGFGRFVSVISVVSLDSVVSFRWVSFRCFEFLVLSLVLNLLSPYFRQSRIDSSASHFYSVVNQFKPFKRIHSTQSSIFRNHRNERND